MCKQQTALLDACCLRGLGLVRVPRRYSFSSTADLASIGGPVFLTLTLEILGVADVIARDARDTLGVTAAFERDA